MKLQSVLNSKKYLKKNYNKFLNLKKHNFKINNVISSHAWKLKDSTKKTIEFLLKKKTSLKNFNWVSITNKNRTKKPMGSKLGGGKSKIDYFYSPLKKYKPILTINSNKLLKIPLKDINKILNQKLKQNVK